MSTDKYLSRIRDLRGQLRGCALPAGDDFYAIQDELTRVWNNFHAYCRRHHIEFPYEEAMR